MTLEFSGQIFLKYSNTKFNENPCNGSRVFPCGWTDRWMNWQTDLTKLIIVFHNFANASKNIIFLNV